jgi:hypothetical protein
MSWRIDTERNFQPWLLLASRPCPIHASPIMDLIRTRCISRYRVKAWLAFGTAARPRASILRAYKIRILGWSSSSRITHLYRRVTPARCSQHLGKSNRISIQDWSKPCSKLAVQSTYGSPSLRSRPSHRRCLQIGRTKPRKCSPHTCLTEVPKINQLGGMSWPIVETMSRRPCRRSRTLKRSADPSEAAGKRQRFKPSTPPPVRPTIRGPDNRRR